MAAGQAQDARARGAFGGERRRGGAGARRRGDAGRGRPERHALQPLAADDQRRAGHVPAGGRPGQLRRDRQGAVRQRLSVAGAARRRHRRARRRVPDRDRHAGADHAAGLARLPGRRGRPGRRVRRRRGQRLRDPRRGQGDGARGADRQDHGRLAGPLHAALAAVGAARLVGGARGTWPRSAIASALSMPGQSPRRV